MKDLRDIIIQQGIARSLKSPSMVIVGKTLSKARHVYFRFLTNSGTQKLVAYFDDRLLNIGALNAESPVIAPDAKYSYGRRGNIGKFLPTEQITNTIRKSFRPRFQWRL